jgi:hypothetical protein
VTDRDRDYLFRVAQVQQARIAVPVPSEAQRRAAFSAIKTMVDRFGPLVGPFVLRWVDPFCPGDFQADRHRACIEFFEDTCPRITLRTDLDPADVRRSMLHELTHLLDEPEIVSGTMSEIVQEMRAWRFSDALFDADAWGAETR